MSNRLITGFIEGLIKYDDVGTIKVLPFQDKIEGFGINYVTEAQFVETFSANGIKGASAACPFREELTVSMNSSNLAWSFLQAAFQTIANDASEPYTMSESVVLSETDGTDSTMSLSYTPSTDPTVDGPIAATAEGEQLPITVAGTTVTFTGDLTGQKVTVTYSVDPSGTNNEIQIGGGQKILNVGIYGQFFGCPDSWLVAIPQAQLTANVNLEVGDNPASASLEARALRDAKGNFAYLQRKPTT